MISNKEEKIDIKHMYGESSIMGSENFLKINNINIQNGLTDNQIAQNYQKYGNNELNQNKPKQWYNYLWDSITSPFNLILIGIILVLFYTDVILTKPPTYSNISVVLFLIIISTSLEFFEVYNSNKAANKLKSLVSTNTTVIRNGNILKIPLNTITFGDVVLLSAGDLIPADLRIIESKNLYVSQSSLTGESDAIEKISNSKMQSVEEIESITDLDNICFMGTNVTSGSGRGVVFRTANHTYFSKIANTISSGKPATNFQKGIASISKLLIRFMLVLIPITFLLNNFRHDTLIAFTFSVAIAIGITPLLLPVILSSSLAKGAIRMSKKKTIVKKLDSIQSFGAMNILCTDKTGTLTEDKIVLEKYLDVKGNEDKRILKHVYLNSYFQTGLKGNIDEAIIKRADIEDLKDSISNYTKIDEIPFDFVRRRLSVVVSDGAKKQLITKGAIEEILEICSMFDYKGTVSTMNSNIKTDILKISKSLNSDGMRVIGVCQKNDINDISTFSPSDEKNMVFLGFIRFFRSTKRIRKSSYRTS